MGILNIRDVTRPGARLVVGLTGEQGSGKTLTAIKFGYGLAGNDASKLGFLDTENGRGRLFSDELPAPFKYAELEAPFSPQRYIDAIAEFQKAGVEVLVIDSVSHCWEGIGGCSDIAENNKSKKGQPNWILAKKEHRRFMNALLLSPMHIIACVRAREKVEVKNANGQMAFISQGVQPIQEKNFWFEVTVGMMLRDAGKKREYLKQLPENYAPFLAKTEGYLTADDGFALRQWIDGGGHVDQSLDDARNELRLIAEGGTESLRTAWPKLAPDVRKALEADPTFMDSIRAAAKENDSNE